MRACVRCGRVWDEADFYRSRRDGVDRICRYCRAEDKREERRRERARREGLALSGGPYGIRGDGEDGLWCAVIEQAVRDARAVNTNAIIRARAGNKACQELVRDAGDAVAWLWGLAPSFLPFNELAGEIGVDGGRISAAAIRERVAADVLGNGVDLSWLMTGGKLGNNRNLREKTA